MPSVNCEFGALCEPLVVLMGVYARFSFWVCRVLTWQGRAVLAGCQASTRCATADKAGKAAPAAACLDARMHMHACCACVYVDPYMHPSLYLIAVLCFLFSTNVVKSSEHTPTHAHIHTHALVQTWMNADLHACAHQCIRSCMHACMHQYTPYKHNYLHTDTHTSKQPLLSCQKVDTQASS